MDVEPLLTLLNEKLGRRVKQLAVVVENGEVVLTGVCDSFHVKQMAQEHLRDRVNGHLIVNKIQVN